MKKNQPFRIAYYIRVSTEEQTLNPEGSLRSQEMRLREYVNSKNAVSNFGEVVGVFVDAGISAKDMNRPKLQEMLKLIRQKEIDLVMVTEISRLSRNMRDFLGMWDMIKDFGGSVMSLRENFDTTTAAGEMLLFQIMGFAQFERKQCSSEFWPTFYRGPLGDCITEVRSPLAINSSQKNTGIWQWMKNKRPRLKSPLMLS